MRLPQSSADLTNEPLAFFAEFLAQPFPERCHATIENVDNVQLGVGFERGRDRGDDPSLDEDLSAIFRAAAHCEIPGGGTVARDHDASDGSP